MYLGSGLKMMTTILVMIKIVDTNFDNNTRIISYKIIWYIIHLTSPVGSYFHSHVIIGILVGVRNKSKGQQPMVPLTLLMMRICWLFCWPPAILGLGLVWLSWCCSLYSACDQNKRKGIELTGLARWRYLLGSSQKWREKR